MSAKMPTHCEFTATYHPHGVVTVSNYTDERAGALVVQVDTRNIGHVRVNLNDWTTWEGNPGTDDPLRALWDAKQELVRALAADDPDDLRYAAEGLFDAVDDHLRNLGVDEGTYQ